MKVILLKDVKKLGQKGDVVNVAEGYGRNYLLPRNLAVEATEGNVKQIDLERKARKEKKNRELQEAETIAARINGQKLKMTAKVGDAGKLFGSITNQEIANRLKKQYKVDIDKRKIELEEPIRCLGKYPIAVRIHSKVKAEVMVQVVEE